jgi:tetratricopeptide (TPR) repeat protein
LWADRDTKLDEALTIARREYESKKDIFTADALAWVLYKKGEFEEAKKISGEAMRLGTNDARILYHAGMIEKRLGSKAEAKRLLQTALKINPSFDLLQSEIAENSLRELN